MRMEGEINNFIVVWVIIIASLCYCHTVGKTFPKGIARFLAILPIVCLFFYLPLKLTTAHLGGTTCFFIAFLASFKILLFAYDKGPLASTKPIPLLRFISLACLPVKVRQSQQTVVKAHKSPLYYATKMVLIAILIHIYKYREYIDPRIILLLYCFHLYFAVEILLAAIAFLVRAFLRVDLEPLFDEPYMATSLQDFWGRRWNLTVTNVLRPTVYEPVRSIASTVMQRKWTSIPAVLATFVVSGLLHELVFYNMGRLKPTGEMMCFFLLHGVALAVEIVIKKVLKGKFCLPGSLSRALTLVFVVTTSFWLYFPTFLRGKIDVKACTEVLAFLEFVKNHRLVDPSNFTRPLTLGNRTKLQTRLGVH